MKKTIAFLTGIVCIFSLTSCGNSSGHSVRSCNTISAGKHHTVSLKSDSTVMAVGWNEIGQCNVSEWTNIRVS